MSTENTPVTAPADSVATPQTSLDDVFGRMYNWKFSQAHAAAIKCDGLPSEFIKALQLLAEDLGDCGWCDGKVFDAARKRNDEAAAILGYKWCNEKDFWVKAE